MQRPVIRGLYMHVPFCFHKCHYCDFYSIVENKQNPTGRHEGFVNALLSELELAAERNTFKIDSIFVGGGTPTLLSPGCWTTLLAGMERLELFTRGDEIEFTVEANPETVTSELLDTLVAGGVNRISIGAQSFQPKLLQTLERWHDPANVARAVQLARQAGIQQINLDLIFATPGQVVDTLNADLDATIALKPDHISCYNLTFEPNTAMTQRLKLGQFQKTPEETERLMYECVMHRLADAGFEHYEISNWARADDADLSGDSPFAGWPGITPPTGADEAPCKAAQTPSEGVGAAATAYEASVGKVAQAASESPHRCVHNQLYWQNKNWIGVGPSAASHVDGHRWKNEAHLGRYLEQSPHPTRSEDENLPTPRQAGERLMMGLRLREGVPRSWIDANLAPNDPRLAEIDYLVGINMLEWRREHLALTYPGLFVADNVIGRLL